MADPAGRSARHVHHSLNQEFVYRFRGLALSTLHLLHQPVRARLLQTLHEPVMSGDLPEVEPLVWLDHQQGADEVFAGLREEERYPVLAAHHAGSQLLKRSAVKRQRPGNQHVQDHA